MREKEDRKRKKKKGKSKKARAVPVPIDPETSDEDDPLMMQLDDSSEYSDEAEAESLEQEEDIFQDREPQVEDFVVVEFELEEGRNVGSKVHYVGKTLHLEGVSKYEVTFLRMSLKHGIGDTFYFPTIEDVATVSRDSIKGVLFEPLRGITQHQSRTMRFLHSLTAFNMR